MPFTLAHPAAAVPLRRYLGSFGVLSALVIGSLTPDMAYFLPSHMGNWDSHGLSGFFGFCLPIGVMTYILFHLFLKHPIISLLPAGVAGCLTAVAMRPRELPAVSPLAVIISLSMGTGTHIAWDSFTHSNGFAVQVLDFLQIELFTVGSYHVHVFGILQYGCTLLGMALLALWSWRWLHKAGASEGHFPTVISSPERIIVISLLIIVSTGIGYVSGIPLLTRTATLAVASSYLRRVVISGLSSLCVMLLVFSILWHLREIQYPGDDPASGKPGIQPS